MASFARYTIIPSTRTYQSCSRREPKKSKLPMSVRTSGGNSAISEYLESFVRYRHPSCLPVARSHRREIRSLARKIRKGQCRINANDRARARERGKTNCRIEGSRECRETPVRARTLANATSGCLFRSQVSPRSETPPDPEGMRERAARSIARVTRAERYLRRVRASRSRFHASRVPVGTRNPVARNCSVLCSTVLLRWQNLEMPVRRPAL